MKERSSVLILALACLAVLAIGLLFRYYSPAISRAETNSLPNLADQRPIGAQYADASLFLSPIKQSRITAAAGTVTGLIVPHHLLAKELAVEAFAYAAAGRYKAVVLLSPDHFDSGRSAVSVTERDFSTVFGTVETEASIAQKLKRLPFVSEGDFFYREHGVQAELPFIRYFFPDAKVMALAFKPAVSKDELDKVIAILEKELPSASLIVQSTDFSHYLAPAQADQRDAETLAVLRQEMPEKILGLRQPDNIDSLAAQYVNARLQADFFHSPLKILDHKNSQDYTAAKVASSTSYIAAAYVKIED